MMLQNDLGSQASEASPMVSTSRFWPSEAMPKTALLLIAGAEPGGSVRELIETLDDIELEHVSSIAAAAGLLLGRDFPVVLLDLEVADARGGEAEVLLDLRRLAPRSALLVMGTEPLDLNPDLERLRFQIEGYLLKDRLDRVRIADAITAAIERRRIQRERFRPQIDAATLLLNQEGFIQRAQARTSELPSTSPIACIVIEVTPTSGFAYDRPEALTALARAIGEKLSSAVRSSDLTCRLGWLSFALLLPGVKPEHLEAITQRLAGQIAPLVPSHHRVRTKGVTCSLSEVSSFEELLASVRRACSDRRAERSY